MTYTEYISQFEIFDNPPAKKGFHRHHIVPVSEQKEPDSRQVYVTKAQHLWLHILYDQENGTHTADRLISAYHHKKEEITCYEDCLLFNDVPEANTGRCGEQAAFFGHKHTNEAKKVMSEKRSGNNHPNYGKHLSEETRRKISESHIGMKPTEEARKKMSKSLKGRTPYNKGKHLSEETRRKISDSKKGHIAHNKGTHISDDIKQKISNSSKGRNLGAKWWTNGIVNKLYMEQPGPDYRLGMIKKKAV